MSSISNGLQFQKRFQHIFPLKVTSVRGDAEQRGCVGDIVSVDDDFHFMVKFKDLVSGEIKTLPLKEVQDHWSREGLKNIKSHSVYYARVQVNNGNWRTLSDLLPLDFRTNRNSRADDQSWWAILEALFPKNKKPSPSLPTSTTTATESKKRSRVVIEDDDDDDDDITERDQVSPSTSSSLSCSSSLSSPTSSSSSSPSSPLALSSCSTSEMSSSSSVSVTSDTPIPLNPKNSAPVNTMMHNLMTNFRSDLDPMELFCLGSQFAAAHYRHPEESAAAHKLLQFMEWVNDIPKDHLKAFLSGAHGCISMTRRT
jgi:hypothetical protein